MRVHRITKLSAVGSIPQNDGPESGAPVSSEKSIPATGHPTGASRRSHHQAALGDVLISPLPPSSQRARAETELQSGSNGRVAGWGVAVAVSSAAWLGGALVAVGLSGPLAWAGGALVLFAVPAVWLAWEITRPAGPCGLE